MGELLKMIIYAYENDDFREPSKDSYALQVNPASIKFKKEVQQTKKGPVGGQFRAPKYSKHKEIQFSFDTILDSTGVLPVSINSVDDEVERLENIIYDLQGELHRPNYLKISWGSFLFKGVLSSIDYDYTLFSSTGLPIRVKISLVFTGYMNKVIADKMEAKKSPDLTRTITLKAGETIAYWCNKIYNDPSYCTDVARYNNLPHFRDVKPGTKIVFPSIQ